MTPGLARMALVLGLLSAIGPVAVDMYLPALPTIAADLGTNVGAVQLSLVSFFLALAVGQPIYGPLAALFGRRPPLIAGLAIFVAAAVGCTFVKSVDALVALRFLQGFGICSAAVIIRAVIRDLHTGPEAARLLSLTLLVLAVSPTLAPLAGSIFIQFFSWQSIFFVLAIAGLAGIAVAVWMLPETLPPERRDQRSFGHTFAGYVGLLRDGRFLSLTVITGLIQGGFFSYIVSSAFYFIEVHGLAPWQYSLVFAANALVLISLAQFSSSAMRRFGAERLIVLSVAVNAASAVLLLAVTLAGIASLPVALPFLFVVCWSLAFVGAPGTVLALDPHGDKAGTASALIGTLQFGISAGASALVSVLFDGTALPMVAVIAACSLLALFFTWLLFGWRPEIA